MKLERDIVWIDTESTGPDPQEDRIIEFGACVVSPDGNRSTFVQRFNPGIPIQPQATEKHHITDADVAECPPFSDWAGRIWKALKGKDIGGYNLRAFDLPIIDAELRRCGGKLDLTGVRIVDAYNIYRKKDPRDLSSAVSKYCNRTHEGAHGAEADSIATADVFEGQMAMYDDLAQMTIEELADFSVPGENKPADIAGKLYYDANGNLCYAFGKNQGKPVSQDLGYARWMMGSNFPGSTLDVLAQELARLASA